jgi:flagellar biosynthesis protein FlhA
LLQRLKEAADTISGKGYQTIVLTSPAIRSHLRKLTERFMPNVVILSSNEIAANVKVQPLETIRINDAD